MCGGRVRNLGKLPQFVPALHGQSDSQFVQRKPRASSDKALALPEEIHPQARGLSELCPVLPGQKCCCLDHANQHKKPRAWFYTWASLVSCLPKVESQPEHMPTLPEQIGKHFSYGCCNKKERKKEN